MKEGGDEGDIGFGRDEWRWSGFQREIWWLDFSSELPLVRGVFDDGTGWDDPAWVVVDLPGASGDE